VQCPVRAFIRLSDGSIFFDASKCVGCELCVRGCPPRAIEVTFPAIGL
jgi:Fe-S-cluster-containing dehydrogenase component